MLPYRHAFSLADIIVSTNSLESALIATKVVYWLIPEKSTFLAPVTLLNTSPYLGSAMTAVCERIKPYVVGIYLLTWLTDLHCSLSWALSCLEGAQKSLAMASADSGSQPLQVCTIIYDPEVSDIYL